MSKINACKITDEFVFFWGSLFSQWYSCEFVDYATGKIKYASTEQYMMQQKALLFEDKEIAEKIMSAKSPNMCKSLGKQVKNFSTEKWITNRISIVTQGNYLKFSQNLSLKNVLMSTGNRIIVEASPFDKIWGIGLGRNDDADVINDVANWQGLNLLGICLMNVRSHFRLIDNVLDTWRN